VTSQKGTQNAESIPHMQQSILWFSVLWEPSVSHYQN